MSKTTRPTHEPPTEYHDYRNFSDLPDDAQKAFEIALRRYRKDHGETHPWSDLARSSWVATMRTARPDVTGVARLRALIIVSRLKVMRMGLEWQKQCAKSARSR